MAKRQGNSEEGHWESSGESSLSERMEVGEHSMPGGSFHNDDGDSSADSSSSSERSSSSSSSSSSTSTFSSPGPEASNGRIGMRQQNGHKSADTPNSRPKDSPQTYMPGRVLGYQIRNRRRNNHNIDAKTNGNGRRGGVIIKYDHDGRKSSHRLSADRDQHQPQSILSLYKSSFRIMTSKKSSTLLLCSIMVWLYVQFHVAYHVQRGDVYSQGGRGVGRHRSNQGKGQRHKTPKQIDQLRNERRKSAFEALGSAAGRLFGGGKSNGKKKRYNNKASKDGYAPAADRLPKDCSLLQWHADSFPNCNDVHDLDLREVLRVQMYGYTQEWERQYQSPSSRHEPLLTNDHTLPFVNLNLNAEHIQEKGKKHLSPSDSTNLDKDRKADIGYVGSGLWRQVWKVRPRLKGDQHEYAVVKVMKSQHDVNPRNFDRHRRDALVMERLTKSPHVVSIYGYCGNSVLTEYAGVTLDDYLFEGTTLSHEHTRYNSKFDANISTPADTFKLQLALDVMKGLKAMHEDDIVHADIQSKQFLLDPRDGVKVNDFNRCRFLPRHDTNKHICKVKIPSAPGGKRSPEEYEMQKIDTKIDVFSAGNILYGILTGIKPFSELTKADVRNNVMKGIKPKVENKFLVKGTPDGDLAHIVDRVFEFNPEKRPSASQIIVELEALLDKYNKLS